MENISIYVLYKVWPKNIKDIKQYNNSLSLHFFFFLVNTWNCFCQFLDRRCYQQLNPRGFEMMSFSVRDPFSLKTDLSFIDYNFYFENSKARQRSATAGRGLFLMFLLHWFQKQNKTNVTCSSVRSCVFIRKFYIGK